ncbi:type II secretion system protein G (GspG) [Ferrimonas sediminum]|uniref:Type II secretion system core protein G n=1 Tax=Ferrimonas sediminum TaxID=718193 RepID=A0A1G8ZI38_9GAMM|nr:type II secretion system major pseudopilin GspG [Ferrimonas sediminum]SDK14717.1 type II secretion system protein G (GspG) [Ferrimonas sediminum]
MRNKHNRQRGFTLLEVMVVLVIIGIMASMIAPNLMGSKDKADIQKAVADIVSLENAMDMYRLDNNIYPTTEQGVTALVNRPNFSPEPRSYREGGYIKRLPKDPWGNDYVLLSPGEKGRFDLCSAGPDFQFGSEDDICNWNLTDYQ